MNRRDALRNLGLFAGAALANRVVEAATTGEIGHVAPTPSVLNRKRKKMVARLADMIIPRTDTPGAIDAGVPGFIDQVVTGWYTPLERSLFLGGLAKLDAFARAHYGANFNECSASQQDSALRQAQGEAADYRTGPLYGIFDPPDEHSPFFFKIKELTVLGYYTSAKGATLELAYNPIPGRYDGDVEFEQLKRQWSS